MTNTRSREAVIEFVRRDAAAGRFDQWGRSTVVDENTRLPSFDKPLFDELHEAAGIDAVYPVGNAGVIHVYGYWFSEVETPYGFKRERWQDGKLAAALGLDPLTFHLHGDGGTTPLERVTAATLPVLRHAPESAWVAEAALAAEPNSAEPISGAANEHERNSRVVCLPARAGHPAVIIYGIESAAGVTMQLVTVFPFQGDPSATLGEFARTPKYRWNAMP